MTKSAREIMEILESFDLTRCNWSAAQLAGCDPKTVARLVNIRDAGADPYVRARRPRLIDPFLEKIEELVERSKGAIRADKVHERLVAMGFEGDERTTRPGRGRGQGRLCRRPPPPLPALGARAGDVAAVRLGRGSPHRRPAHQSVLRLGGLVFSAALTEDARRA